MDDDVTVDPDALPGVLYFMSPLDPGVDEQAIADWLTQPWPPYILIHTVIYNIPKDSDGPRP